jgi:hypothetical protein
VVRLEMTMNNVRPMPVVGASHMDVFFGQEQIRADCKEGTNRRWDLSAQASHRRALSVPPKPAVKFGLKAFTAEPQRL